MIVLIVLAALALSYLILTGGTWVVQWGLTEITGMEMPFWPIFWILVVLSVLIGGGSSATSRN